MLRCQGHRDRFHFIGKVKTIDSIKVHKTFMGTEVHSYSPPPPNSQHFHLNFLFIYHGLLFTAPKKKVS